ncbi:MAG: iron chelate uptake ABC transporter family permease subunit [Propionicimonas sp.]|uniref:FecCD family ABC transporter permease n=1 Tax=Propionicimonas sp. TaxID=1955623 RepID=UPI002B20509F|nr:iron chelate uptake ABC transporter family permease subunit [Propionicimonas sp.]MEA4945180.1 iron chelate uptake ABC transporter family permease subunit [Propionicimonas sp.]MEA5052950.1 iron chelate uptake ABC transporter family permease subunit [Propionicimonas sp.]MEA5116866.1 iron chelate uptake ABC transporter family permease subunit [Propionicimonas sp.]
MSAATVAAVRLGRARQLHRRRLILTLLAALVVVTFAASLMIGHTFYPPETVLQVILGRDAGGANFTVGELRLPRAIVAVVVGLCFGMGGVTFQTMLRNQLASPDIIGITAGAGAAAAFAIIVLRLSDAQVSVFAIVAGLAVALLVYLLSFRSGVLGTRLILVGIGVAAMLDSVTSYLLSRAGEWDLQQAMRWLAGSLNGATWGDAVTVSIAFVALAPVLLAQSRNLTALRLGDDTAGALGVGVERTRVLLIITAVGLIAFGTAAAGPVAFVAFLSGPIAARILGPRGSLLVPAGLVGALLVAVADFLGQWALGTRFPVGVVTGVLGAPYLVYLIVRTNRAGGSL